jgi:hypothetical protein
MNNKDRNECGFLNLPALLLIAAMIIIIFIGYNSIVGHQKINKIRTSLDSLVKPTGLQLKNKTCSGASIDTQAMCSYSYTGNATFETSQLIAEQFIAKGYTVLDKREDVSYIRLWELKGDGNIVSISVFSGDKLTVNSEAGASKD